MASVEFRHVWKKYEHGPDAVKDLSLNIEDGEFMIVVGPSGCGKSTALRVVAGLEAASEGEVVIGGEVVNRWAPGERGVAMVFQNYALYPHMKVRKNLSFGLMMAGRPPDEIEALVRETAAALHLTEELDRKPSQLSGGQKQRVAMGRALIKRPSVFLMDEPLSNLDAQLRVEMRAMIGDLHRRLGTTTIYVTHDQTEAMTLGDRVAVMKDGRLQQVGSPSELYDEPANPFVASFIGSPAMNLFTCRLVGQTLETPWGTLTLSRPALEALDGRTSRDVVAGLRAEQFALSGDDAAGEPSLCISPRVENVEYVGSAKYLHFRVEPRRNSEGGMLGRYRSGLPDTTIDWCVARVEPRANVLIGDHINLWLVPSALHLFDAGTGTRLTAQQTNVSPVT